MIQRKLGEEKVKGDVFLWWTKSENNPAHALWWLWHQPRDTSWSEPWKNTGTSPRRNWKLPKLQQPINASSQVTWQDVKRYPQLTVLGELCPPQKRQYDLHVSGLWPCQQIFDPDSFALSPRRRTFSKERFGSAGYTEEKLDLIRPTPRMRSWSDRMFGFGLGRGEVKGGGWSQCFGKFVSYV